MNVRGRIRNGVVVLDPGPVLPEGTVVTVSCEDVPTNPSNGQKRRINFPLVPFEHPGSVFLTGDRLAELLAEADVSSWRESLARARLCAGLRPHTLL